METSRAIEILGLCDLPFLLKQLAELPFLLKQLDSIGFETKHIRRFVQNYVHSFVTEKHMALLFENAERTNVKNRLHKSYLQAVYRKNNLCHEVGQLVDALCTYVSAYVAYRKAKLLYEQADEDLTRLDASYSILNSKWIARRQLTQMTKLLGQRPVAWPSCQEV